MDTTQNLFYYFLSALLAFCMIQGCAGMGAATSNDRIYSKSFEESKDLVREGVQMTNLAIEDISEASDKQRMTYYVSRYTSVNDRKRQQERGKVIVAKVDEEHTSVDVENPEYHYTVPNYERQDYRRKLYRVFDKVFGENKES